MTFSGLNFPSFAQTSDLGNINYSDISIDTTPFVSNINIDTGYDWGSFWDFGQTPKFNVDFSGVFDLPNLGGLGSLAPLPKATASSGFGDIFKGILELPSILSVGKGILQGVAANAAYQNAAAEAGIRSAAENQRYWAQYADQVAQNYRGYQTQLETYYRDLDYAQRRRDYEDQLALQQAEYKGAVSTQAFKNFEKQIADLEGRFYEEEAKETIELENIRMQSIASASKAKAKGQAGRSIERLSNQYHQQYLANLSNREITRNYRIADKTRQVEALDVARQNTSNQIQFYTPQPIPDPVKPLAPLPITAVPPTPEAGPSGTGLTIDLANIGLDVLKNYQSMQPPAPKPVGSQ